MAENKDIVGELLINLKSVIQSCKGGVPLSDLENDYKCLIGKSIPLAKIGYNSLEAFLKSIPDVVKLKRDYSGQVIAEAVTDASTAHLAKLISKQKDKPPNKTRSSRIYKTVKPYQNNYFRCHQSVKVRPSQQENQSNQKYVLPRSRKSKENAIKQMNQQNSKSHKEKIQYSQNKSCHNFEICLNDEKVDKCQKKVIYTDQNSLAVIIINKAVELPNNSSAKPEIIDNSIENNQEKCFGKDSALNNSFSNILLVQNLVRPFTLPQLKKMLKETGKLVEEDFWIDRIKSKCFVTYESIDEAIKTKNALNGLKWPEFSPKTLIVDFSTEEMLKLHKNTIPQPKPASEYIPPGNKYENKFLRRLSNSPEKKVVQKVVDRFKPYSQRTKENKIPEERPEIKIGSKKSVKFETVEGKENKYREKEISEKSYDSAKYARRILTRSLTQKDLRCSMKS